jgi:hypothetical protein
MQLDLSTLPQVSLSGPSPLCIQLQVVVVVVVVVEVVVIIIISQTQPEYYILFITKMILLKMTACSAFIILGHLQVVYILFQGKLYNAYSVVSVSLDHHDYKRDLVFVSTTYIRAYFIAI